MRWPALTVAACVAVGLASPSFAGQVKLDIRNGLVTLDAKDATLREIFAEWARVGKTRVVNAESVPGGPMSVQLTDVPERQALETLLRSVAGFLAVARAVPADAASMYDRIVLMAVARPAVAPASTNFGPGGQLQLPSARDRIVVPQPVATADDDDESQTAPILGQGAYGGAQQPGMPTPLGPYGIVGPQNPNAQQASPAPKTPPAAQATPRPGMATNPIIKPPGQSGEIK